jgi:hypothetical protein
MEQIEQLVDAWIAAEAHNDAAAVEPLLEEEFRGIGPLGFVLDKQQWLDRFRSSDFAYSALEWQDRQTRNFGHTALVVARHIQAARYRGTDSNGSFRATLVAVRQPEGWKIAHVQLSMLGAPPANLRAAAAQAAG